MDKYGARHATRLDLVREVERLTVMVDKLLNHCDKDNGECLECSKIVCPYECELHFHHDGCPACAQQPPTHKA